MKKINFYEVAREHRSNYIGSSYAWKLVWDNLADVLNISLEHAPVFEDDGWLNQLNKYSEGSVIKLVKVKDLVKLNLTIPSLEEQKKYMGAIHLIDEEIQLQKELINENMNLKEAIIQKTQGGE